MHATLEYLTSDRDARTPQQRASALDKTYNDLMVELENTLAEVMDTVLKRPSGRGMAPQIKTIMAAAWCRTHRVYWQSDAGPPHWVSGKVEDGRRALHQADRKAELRQALEDVRVPPEAVHKSPALLAVWSNAQGLIQAVWEDESADMLDAGLTTRLLDEFLGTMDATIQKEHAQERG